MKKSRKAFTIVELVIVIAVIGILATVLVPVFGEVIGNAKDAAAKQDAKNAYTDYMVEYAGAGEIPELFLYKAEEGRVVALLNGAAVGVYTDFEEAVIDLIGAHDDGKLNPTADEKLFAYDGKVPSQNETEDPNATYRIDPLTYYKEVSYDNGITWIRTDTRADHSSVTAYNYPMENVQILKGGIRKDTWIYRDDDVENYCGAIILIEDTIFDQVTITANDKNGFVYAFLDDDLVNGVKAPFSKNYKYQQAVTGQTGTKTFIIPDEAKYLYVYSNSGNTNYLPATISFEKSCAEYRIDPITYYKEVSYDNGKTWVATDVRAAHSDIIEYNYPLENVHVLAGSIRDNNGWKYAEGGDYCGALILIEDTIFDQVSITANDNYNFAFAFLCDDLVNGKSVPFAQGYSSVITGNKGTKTFDIPNNARYLYIYHHSEDRYYLPAAIKFEKKNKATESNSFTISTWNIGHFNSGSSMTVEAYKTFVQKQLGTDLICLNEYSTDYEGKSMVFQGYTGYEGPWRNYSCNAIYYKDLNITEPEQKEFICNENQLVPAGNLRESDYYYVTTVVTVNGKEVTVIATHLIFDKTNPEDDQINKDQIKELIELLKNTERVVLLGDWNCIMFEQFDLFKEAGYSLGNNDPNLRTFKNNAVNSNALDNIIYKGVMMEDFALIETGLSDHNALKCTIVVE